jgi:hypothetical protein
VCNTGCSDKPLQTECRCVFCKELPPVPIPLLPPDEDVPLNLQQAVDDCFALVGYEALLDYSQSPPPPDLTGKDAEWLKHILMNQFID